MSAFYSSRKQRLAALKLIAAKDPVMEALRKLGFDLAKGVKYAKQYFDRLEEQSKFAGPLLNDAQLVKQIVEQLPSGQIEFPYETKRNLGRMRAVVRFVCLQNGYVPYFKKVEGQDRFYTQTISTLTRDDYSTVYMVPVGLMNEEALRFISLPDDIKRALDKLAY